jgi:hypothetical protein
VRQLPDEYPRPRRAPALSIAPTAALRIRGTQRTPKVSVRGTADGRANAGTHSPVNFTESRVYVIRDLPDYARQLRFWHRPYQCRRM